MHLAQTQDPGGQYLSNMLFLPNSNVIGVKKLEAVAILA